MPNNMHNMQNDNMQNNMQINMQNMQTICRFGSDCLVLTVICRICQIICSICPICYDDFQYAQYALPTLPMSEAQAEAQSRSLRVSHLSLNPPRSLHRVQAGVSLVTPGAAAPGPDSFRIIRPARPPSRQKRAKKEPKKSQKRKDAYVTTYIAL